MCGRQHFYSFCFCFDFACSHVHSLPWISTIHSAKAPFRTNTHLFGITRTISLGFDRCEISLNLLASKAFRFQMTFPQVDLCTCVREWWTCELSLGNSCFFFFALVAFVQHFCPPPKQQQQHHRRVLIYFPKCNYHLPFCVLAFGRSVNRTNKKKKTPERMNERLNRKWIVKPAKTKAKSNANGMRRTVNSMEKAYKTRCAGGHEKEKTLSQVLILSEGRRVREEDRCVEIKKKRVNGNGENLKRLKNFCVVPDGWLIRWFDIMAKWFSSSRSRSSALRALYSWLRHANQILERNFNTHWPDTCLANKHTQSKQSHAIQSNRTQQ